MGSHCRSPGHRKPTSSLEFLLSFAHPLLLVSLPFTINLSSKSLYVHAWTALQSKLVRAWLKEVGLPKFKAQAWPAELPHASDQPASQTVHEDLLGDTVPGVSQDNNSTATQHGGSEDPSIIRGGAAACSQVQAKAGSWELATSSAHSMVKLKDKKSGGALCCGSQNLWMWRRHCS